MKQIPQVTVSDGRIWTAVQINAWLQDKHGFALNERYLAEVTTGSRPV